MHSFSHPARPVNRLGTLAAKRTADLYLVSPARALPERTPQRPQLSGWALARRSECSSPAMGEVALFPAILRR